MNTNDVQNFFKEKIIKIKFETSTTPLDYALGEDNQDRYNELKTEYKLKCLNLEVISKNSEFNSVYISVFSDDSLDKFIVFYNVYTKYVRDYYFYKEINFQDDLNLYVLTLLRENDADPEAIEEKIIFE